jgi:hypothetical protein
MTRPILDSSSNQRRPQAHLPNKLDRRLIAYSAAATAAGVGLLVLSEPAEAKIVYTAANITIPADQSVSFDLNHDGIPDFGFYFYQYGAVRKPLGYHEEGLAIDPSKTGNAIWSVQSSKGDACAAALPPGVKVGPGADFQDKSLGLWGSGGTAYSGPFVFCEFGKRTRGAFLGLKFLISGQTHYGWAHVTVDGSRAVLNGYAYETVPNQPITTGKTSGPVEVGESLPVEIPAQLATLGALARGSQGLDIWRKVEEEIEN